ncbi:hypothetical protein GLW05_11785 [Pontibacillus yanchengensis]|uniref:Uncharacterized protein n=1 Tax=Pontibacillus yanchengensis TaxID=462910 RepID=A0A6I5A410_9BACI|nr:hypothetical protein [Pontibacillus yanchengensis]MYL34279.1 hypothetical protein [Pontibacillus yanchengensis]
MRVLIDDVKAFVYLYGRVPKATLVEVLNQVAERSMDERDLEKSVAVAELKNYGIKIVDSVYVSESFLSLNYSEEELQEKERQPYYIPSKSELENYEFPQYVEPTPASSDLYFFLLPRYLRRKKAWKITKGIQHYCRSSKGIDHLPSLFQRKKLKITHEEYPEFKSLIENVINQSRMYELNGHTPLELDWGIKLTLSENC